MQTLRKGFIGFELDLQDCGDLLHGQPSSKEENREASEGMLTVVLVAGITQFNHLLQQHAEQSSHMTPVPGRQI
jgi:hypothetical protein